VNILVTGGTGLIGKAFIYQYYPQYQFTVLSRSPKRAKTQLPNNVAIIDDLLNLNDLNGFDAVINLAGEPIIDKRWTASQKQIVCESRWSITEQLVELFKKSSFAPKVFLSGSAIGIYGDRGNAELDESDSFEADDFPSLLCRRWEEIAGQAEPYTRTVYLRTGIVLTAEGGALKKMLLPFKCGVGGKIGSGQQYMSWIHYRDMIAAINYILNNPQISGAVNMVAPVPEANQIFTQQLASALNRLAVLPVPAWLLRILLGESSCLLLASQRVRPKKLLDSGFVFSNPELSLALADLLD
jgi:uncharacterized protein (TIGR01777 family)